MTAAVCWRLAARQLLRFRLRTAVLLATGALSAALVIASLNYSAAGRADLLQQLDGAGGDLLTITPALSRNVGGRARTGSAVTTLRDADLAALLRLSPEIAGSTEVASGNFLAKAGDLSKNGAAITGVQPAFFALRRWPTASGSLFDAAAERRAARVAVLGAAVARDLFGASSPVGRPLLINRVPFQVVGVLSARGQRLDALNEDDEIVIPYSTAEHRLMNRAYDSAWYLQIAPPEAMPEVAARARALLRRRHHEFASAPDDFKILSQRDVIAAQEAASSHLQRVVQAAGGGGLLATGLVLLALHALAVGARQHELGIRRALGATESSIFAQLVCEAVLLALAIAAVALALGWLFTRVAEQRARLAFQFDPAVAALIVAIALLVDVVASLLPARRAARRDPALTI